MNELEKIQWKKELFNFLLNTADSIGIDWQNLSEYSTKVAGMCAEELTGIFFVKERREKEKREGIKRTPSSRLQNQIKANIKRLRSQWEVDPKADIFYFPGTTETGEYFNDQQAKYWLKIILPLIFYLPENLTTEKDNIRLNINYLLALKGGFYSLGLEFKLNPKELEKLTPLIFRMYGLLTDLVNKTRKIHLKVAEEERIGDSNSQSTLVITDRKLLKIKSHNLYPKIKKILNKYQTTQDENNRIDEIIDKMKIPKMDDEQTIRRYRRLIIEDYQAKLAGKSTDFPKKVSKLY